MLKQPAPIKELHTALGKFGIVLLRPPTITLLRPPALLIQFSIPPPMYNAQPPPLPDIQFLHPDPIAL